MNSLPNKPGEDTGVAQSPLESLPESSAEGGGREGRVGRAFVSLADTLVEGYDIIDLLDRLVGHSVALLAADAAAIMLVDASGRLQAVASSSEDADLMELLQLQVEQGPCVECFDTGGGFFYEVRDVQLNLNGVFLTMRAAIMAVDIGRPDRAVPAEATTWSTAPGALGNRGGGDVGGDHVVLLTSDMRRLSHEIREESLAGSAAPGVQRCESDVTTGGR